jgi:hypothetical protein
VPDGLSRLASALSAEESARLDAEPDIYDTLQVQGTIVHVSDELVDQFQKGYDSDPFFKGKFAELRRRFAGAPEAELPIIYNNLMLEDAELHTHTPQASGAKKRRFLIFLVEGETLRLCIPKDLHKPFLEMGHDRHNHAGIDRTYQRLRRSYYMKSMSRVVQDYVKHCPVCLINKPPKFQPSGKLIPIAAPSLPWELVTMDFVVKLPESSPVHGLWEKITLAPRPAYDSLLTITCKLTKHVRL